MFQGKVTKRVGPKARLFLVMSRETNDGTEKTWETVAEAMVSKVAKPDPVGICKP